MALALLGSGPERAPSAQEAAHASPARAGGSTAEPSAAEAADPGRAALGAGGSAEVPIDGAAATVTAPTTATVPEAGAPAPAGSAPLDTAAPAAAVATLAPGTTAPAGAVTAATAVTATVDPTALDFAHSSLADIRAATLARISYPWQSRLPGWSIDFLPGKDGYLGATWSRTHRIEIYVRDGQSVDELAFTLAHELGHAVDLTYFDATDRDRWLAARGAAGASWWTDSGAGDYAVGAGDFAESFAVWQIGGRSLSTLAGQPTEAQLALLAELVTG